jgi:hypothetical protein
MFIIRCDDPDGDRGATVAAVALAGEEMGSAPLGHEVRRRRVLHRGGGLSGLTESPYRSP